MDNRFDEIRPYHNHEVQTVIEELLHDKSFNRVLKGIVPWMPSSIRNKFIRLVLKGANSTLGFQLRIMKPMVDYVLFKASKGTSFAHDKIQIGDERYTFVSNHRDIVLDSAILDVMLFKAGFPTTCEIAIGDNLLIYPWIKKLVKLNKAFTVRRGLSTRELLQSSILMSEYMHYAVQEKKENIWIAQREGRAKDSNDLTQESVLKMLALGGEGSHINRLKALHIVPLTISYEYDPCDYLKAKEMQQKRDDPQYKKSKQDDLQNMKTGIWGQKGRIHYQCASCINAWLDELADLPKAEFFTQVAQRMDREIHQGYKLFPGNYVAYDWLHGNSSHQAFYSPKEKKRFETYIQKRLALIELSQKDVPYLTEQLLRMYANPVINKEKA